MVMGSGPVMHGDDDGDGFEEAMRDSALGRQLIPVNVNNPNCRLT